MSTRAAAPWLPFEELVQAHWRWRSDAAAEPEYREKLEAFERECGDIVDSYWCTNVPSAIAMTEAGAWPFRSRLRFHRVSDWATKNEPDVGALLHKCDELSIKIGSILRGPTREIAMRLVVSSASHVLSIVDEPAEHRRGADRARALRDERTRIENAERYYDEVGRRQAQIVYLEGMVLGVLLVAALAWGVWGASGRDFSNRIVLATWLGAAGAFLSVMNRMSDPKQGFQLDYELGRMPLIVLGLFRPLLGATFGLVVYAALASGLVNLQLAGGSSDKETAFYALLSFVGGWSERLAKDVLDAAEQTIGGAIKDKQTRDSAKTLQPARDGTPGRSGQQRSPE